MECATVVTCALGDDNSRLGSMDIGTLKMHEKGMAGC